MQSISILGIFLLFILNQEASSFKFQHYPKTEPKRIVGEGRESYEIDDEMVDKLVKAIIIKLHEAGSEEAVSKMSKVEVNAIASTVVVQVQNDIVEKAEESDTEDLTVDDVLDMIATEVVEALEDVSEGTSESVSNVKESIGSLKDALENLMNEVVAITEGSPSPPDVDEVPTKSPEAQATSSSSKAPTAPSLIEAEVTTSTTISPTAPPTESPIASPTESPITSPTESPIAAPTESPITSPTESPINSPTESPIAEPTESPIAAPTESPIAAPTESPITAPTESPIASPTESPITASTGFPTEEPTESPIAEPTESPIAEPTESPIAAPTEFPIASPTISSTSAPTLFEEIPVENVTVAPTLEDLADSAAKLVADIVDEVLLQVVQQLNIQGGEISIPDLDVDEVAEIVEEVIVEIDEEFGSDLNESELKDLIVGIASLVVIQDLGLGAKSRTSYKSEEEIYGSYSVKSNFMTIAEQIVSNILGDDSANGHLRGLR